ncbi:dolichyl-phosphate-mannose--protein mannosyltransferase [Nocardioides donggukensis]|uniref:dolichyl-phosphate-mannose--protein mannosyltransferase n=1 Tax=Nocardioides donggukensis TaxID=2774019 RepID=UPI00191DBA0C|nr:phospholipid carrier-dependent glycosyltransferase [Nocardioides donggukensis]
MSPVVAPEERAGPREPTRAAPGDRGGPGEPGGPVPPARDRARPLARLEDPLIGWVAAAAVAVLAFALRVWRLGNPREFSFDETYYAKDAWSMLQHGYVRDYVDGANERILEGDLTGLFQDEPSMIVHPEVGKWLIALGEQAFGFEPFGWRFASAVAGALMVLALVRLVRRLTGSTMLGCVAGLLLCFDGMQLVLSRLALLDVFLAMFLVLAASCLVADREWTRARLSARLASAAGEVPRWGPRVWFRPWLLGAGIWFGLALGTKWSAIYPLAAFGLLVWAWDSGFRRSIGVRWPVLRSAVLDGVPAFVHLVVVAGLVYTVSWTGWLLHAGEYEEHLSQSQYTVHLDGDPWPTSVEPDAEGFVGETWQSLRSLYHYHRDVYQFHTEDLDDSTHVYASDPAGWLLLARPVGVNVESDIAPGTQGCRAPAESTCLREVLLIGTPVLWWGGALALAYAAVAWLGMRDWRFGFALVGAVSLWLPWELNDDRPIFLFYASAVLPFTIVALTLIMGHLLGRARAPSSRRTIGTIVAGSFFVLVLLNFAWFWPIWTNGLLTRDEWLDRIWFSRWI